jgi:hypothetical protein
MQIHETLLASNHRVLYSVKHQLPFCRYSPKSASLFQFDVIAIFEEVSTRKIPPYLSLTIQDGEVYFGNHTCQSQFACLFCLFQVAFAPINA